MIRIFTNRVNTIVAVYGEYAMDTGPGSYCLHISPSTFVLSFFTFAFPNRSLAFSLSPSQYKTEPFQMGLTFLQLRRVSSQTNTKVSRQVSDTTETYFPSLFNHPKIFNHEKNDS